MSKTAKKFVKKDSKKDEATRKSIADQKTTLLTKEGLKSITEELDVLKMVKRREVAERIKEAISYGDLSENSEYEDAKNEQAFTEGRILELEEMVKNAQVIASNKVVARIVQLGTKVTLKYLNDDTKKVVEYTIVGSTEADPFDGKISNKSPIGNALLEKTIGDKIEVFVPVGVVKFEILD